MRLHGPAELAALLAEWPVESPRDWLKWVNEPQTDEEVELLRLSVNRGRPLGRPEWAARTAERLGLGHTLRPPGRPLGWRKRRGEPE